MTSNKSIAPKSNTEYNSWLTDLKQRVREAQMKAVVAVNSELVLLYWRIGRDILERQHKHGWGANVVNQLSDDLRKEFPDMKGFSPRNLNSMLSFARECHGVITLLC